MVHHDLCRELLHFKEEDREYTIKIKYTVTFPQDYDITMNGILASIAAFQEGDV